ncbi:amino acid ABC transporter substrate-binding protein [Roseomonas marmotae]|uniref:Amino acid ABC transporter substrate-binding protein n=1 Tax=Roseomonas marmotae TaxID=2768161 RepID=A0ABS3K8P6_9PROT|nr:amino acid ABC transporter substrate-binding protein [Roseomonas marmotae]MBO1073382.1 amino acid ABC transporter substrate-binding protein [Roseomonas marmotae]QTI80418.1 amino acid ABC transporter substrate-binding protein [Roseomonas marmotae]
MRLLPILLTLLPSLATMQPALAGPTLEGVRARGELVCGVNTGVAGFSAPDAKGEFQGLDADFCRAIAAATLGDAAKARFMPTTYQTRFVALQSGEVDVLARNVTQTLSRDTALGFNMAGVNFYDGQGFMVPKASGILAAKQLDGATVCVLPGSTSELNLGDWSRREKIQVQPVVLSSMDEMTAAYQSGRCDSMTTDASQLAALRVSALRAPADHVILPERISKEPLGPMVRHGDEQWRDIVFWTLSAMIEAEEMGITRANVVEMKASTDPNIQRLLGVTPGFGKALGLPEDWAFQVIRQVGNYGESFARHLGDGSAIGLERGHNNLWTRGGLMYALPLR